MAPRYHFSRSARVYCSFAKLSRWRATKSKPGMIYEEHGDLLLCSASTIYMWAKAFCVWISLQHPLIPGNWVIKYYCCCYCRSELSKQWHTTFNQYDTSPPASPRWHHDWPLQRKLHISIICFVQRKGRFLTLNRLKPPPVAKPQSLSALPSDKLVHNDAERCGVTSTCDWWPWEPQQEPKGKAVGPVWQCREWGGMKKAHHMGTLTRVIKSDSLSEVWSLKSDTTG